MPLPGEESAHFGFRYDHLWIISSFIKIISEEEGCKAISIHPPGREGEGVEFVLESDEKKEYYQAKRQSSRGRWSLYTLKKEGVLSTFKDKLLDSDCLCVFVSGNAAHELDELGKAARSSDNLQHFKTHYISSKLRTKWFLDLRNYWANCGEIIAYNMLQRISTRVYDENSLVSDIDRGIKYHFIDDPNIVRSLLIESITHFYGRKIAAIDIWRYCVSKGLGPRELRNDPRNLIRIQKANQQYQIRRERNLIQGECIGRASIIEKLIQWFESPDSSKAAVLLGEAGVGKSSVILPLMEHLGGNEIPHLVLSLDLVQIDSHLPVDIGKKYDLLGSPILSLDAVSADKPALLIIDQLDTISTISGRQTQARAGIEELVRECISHANCKILFSCRTFDYKQDAYFTKLAKVTPNTATFDVQDFSKDQVRSILVAVGMPTGKLSDDQLTLLSHPLNLKLFIDIVKNTNTTYLDFNNTKDLFDKFWEIKRSAAQERSSQRIQWTGVIDTLVNHMSDKQVLSAPTIILDHVSEDAKVISSEGVIHYDSPTTTFFHESFFDYCFARRFLSSGRNLHDLLAQDDQGLFRRLQVRQVLIHLRDENYAEYLNNIKSLIRDPLIRFHIKQLIFAYLTNLKDPKTEELDFILSLTRSEDSDLIKEAWNAICWAHPWFILLDKKGFIEKWLSSESSEDNNRVTNILRSAFEFNPDRIAELLNTKLGTSREWNERIRMILAWPVKAASRKLIDLILNGIDEGLFGEASGQFTGSGELSFILEKLLANSSAWACEVLGKYLDHQFSLNPESYDLADYRGLEALEFKDQAIIDCAKQSPLEFYLNIFPFMHKAIIAHECNNGTMPVEDYNWAWTHINPHMGTMAAILISMENAFVQLANTHTNIFREIYAKLFNCIYDTVQFLLVRAFTSNPLEFADEAAEYLLQADYRMRCGYAYDNYWATYELLVVITPLCNEELYKRLEEAILFYKDPHEIKPGNQRFRGKAEFTLLSGMDTSRLSEQGRRRLRELQRKFERKCPEAPKGLISGFVQPPISREIAAKMTDQQWLRAVEKYGPTYVRHRTLEDGLKGGPEELAHILGELTKKDPERFARLLLQIPDSSFIGYFNSILRGLTGSELSNELFHKVCLRCHSLAGHPCGKDISYLVKSFSKSSVSVKIFDIIIWYATEDENPMRGEWVVSRQTNNGDRCHDLDMNGINTVRGSAAIAIASLLFAHPEKLSALIGAIEKMINDHHPAVRACVAETLCAVWNCDKTVAVRYFTELCNTTEDIFTSKRVQLFVYYGVQTEHYTDLEPIVVRMMEHSSEKVATEGAVFACLASLGRDEAKSLAEKCRTGEEKLRLGAAKVAAANVRNLEFQERCEPELKVFLNDPSEKVRKSAANCFMNFEPEQLHEFDNLIKDFIHSAAFKNNTRWLFHHLRQLEGKLPDFTYEMAKTFLDVAGEEATDLRTSLAGEAYELGEIVLRAYNESIDEPEWSRKYLDLMDQMAKLGIGGLDFSKFKRQQ